MLVRLASVSVISLPMAQTFILSLILEAMVCILFDGAKRLGEHLFCMMSFLHASLGVCLAVRQCLVFITQQSHSLERSELQTLSQSAP